MGDSPNIHGLRDKRVGIVNRPFHSIGRDADDITDAVLRPNVLLARGARELHAMARHRDREAELMLKKKPGPATDEFVKQMRQLTRRLHQAATYADVQAKEAEREIPPDMIQQFHSTLR